MFLKVMYFFDSAGLRLSYIRFQMLMQWCSQKATLNGATTHIATSLKP